MGDHLFETPFLDYTIDLGNCPSIVVRLSCSSFSLSKYFMLLGKACGASFCFGVHFVSELPEFLVGALPSDACADRLQMLRSASVY